MGRLKRLALNLAVLGTASLVTLLLAEGVLRFAAHRVLHGGEWATAGQIFRKVDPPVGFSLEPGSTQLLVTGGAYTSRATINSAGMRDVEHALNPAPGVKRILVLGDSFMFGQGVRMDETLPRRLAAMLPGVEVINTGTPGYDLGQYYLLYEDRAYRYQPDLVLVGFFINDLARARELDVTYDADGLPVSYQRSPEMIAKDIAGAPRGITGAVSSWFREHSLLYVLVRRHLDGLMAGRRRPPRSAEDRAADTPYLSVFRRPGSDAGETADWDRADRILDALERSVQDHGARFAVILIPAPFQTSDAAFEAWLEWAGASKEGLSRREPQDRVMSWCARSDTPCLDLLPVFEKGDRDELYFPYDMHWTAKGHERAARAVADFLEAHRLP